MHVQTHVCICKGVYIHNYLFIRVFIFEAVCFIYYLTYILFIQFHYVRFTLYTLFAQENIYIYIYIYVLFTYIFIDVLVYVFSTTHPIL